MATEQKKPFNIQTILIVLLVISSFLIGSLYTKVQYLEKGAPAAGGGGVKPVGKYKSFEDAISALAKDAGLDGKKLVSCMNSGGKQATVEADTREGESLGVSGTPAFFVNGRLLSGAFDISFFKEVIDKELAGLGSNDPRAYSQQLQEANKEGAFNPAQVQVAVANAPVLGGAKAAVTLVEYSDFQCPFCGRAYPTVKKLLSDYGDKLRFAYKHFPLVTIHPRAQKVAEASECAKDQGKFWEFHDKVFEAQTDWASL